MSPNQNGDTLSLQKIGGLPKILNLVYQSPYSGEATDWQIQVQEIYESNEHVYLEAFCQHRQELRTFRMDRILRIEAS